MASKDPGVARLFEQLDAIAPNRSRASDGWIADENHTTGQHVPEYPPPPGNPPYEVDAGDYTHDPVGGCDIGQVFERIRLSRDSRVYYMIFNKRICSSYANSTRPAWEWGPYSNADDEPHDKHGHLSVLDNPRHGGDWAIGTPTQGDDIMRWFARADREGHAGKFWFGDADSCRLVTAGEKDTLFYVAYEPGVNPPRGGIHRDNALPYGNPIVRGNRDGMGPERAKPATAADIAAALLPALTAELVAAMPESVLTMAEAEMACSNALARVRFELS